MAKSRMVGSSSGNYAASMEEGRQAGAAIGGLFKKRGTGSPGLRARGAM